MNIILSLISTQRFHKGTIISSEIRYANISEMVRITEDLVRKRAEHNECEISTLEEVSLHQQDIERIEHLDKWCRELKILYLQSNLIPKIENVSRLKKLEYLNLALNNIERVENLEGCESLKKLDLTVNFVGELTSIESLKENYNLTEMYLTGNPCTEYEGYKEFVIAALPQLKILDGHEVEKSERIKACQDFALIRAGIVQQQEEYKRKRAMQKEESERKKKQNDAPENADEKVGDDKENSLKPGFDGRWYTDINESDKKDDEAEYEKRVDAFWHEKVPYTPESRLDIHNHLKKLKDKEEKKNDKKEKPPRKYFADDGRPLNINESKIDFSLTEDDSNLLLNLKVFRYLDTSLMDCDVQPHFLRVTIKGKVFQLCLPEEVNAEKSFAKRSQTTGNLLITMPKIKQVLKPQKPPQVNTKSHPSMVKASLDTDKKSHQLLEVDSNAKTCVDISNIVKDSSKPALQPLTGKRLLTKEERPNSENFVDNPDVPPLL